MQNVKRVPNMLSTVHTRHAHKAPGRTQDEPRPERRTGKQTGHPGQSRREAGAQAHPRHTTTQTQEPKGPGGARTGGEEGGQRVSDMR